MNIVGTIGRHFGRLILLLVITVIVTGLLLEASLMSETGARFDKRGELTQCWISTFHMAPMLDMERIVAERIRPICREGVVLLSSFAVRPSNEPTTIWLETRRRFWAVSGEKSCDVRLWPVTQSYIDAASSTNGIHGRLPEKPGEAVLTHEEAARLFSDDPYATIGQRFRIAMKASDELLKLFPEGTFDELKDAPDWYDLVVVGVTDADYESRLASRNRSPERTTIHPRTIGASVLLLSTDLYEPAILGGFALWPDGMQEAMSRLPVAASAFMRTDEELWPIIVDMTRQRLEKGELKRGLASMGEYTWGQAELARNEWYIQFRSVSDLHRAWPALSEVVEEYEMRLIGTAPYTIEIAPLIVFLANVDSYAMVPLLLLLLLLGVLLGNQLAARESRWLAVMLAYGGLRGKVLRKALAYSVVAGLTAMAITVPLLQWLLGLELQHASSLLARFDVHLSSNVLPDARYVGFEVFKASGLFVLGLLGGAIIFILRAYNTEVGLLLKRQG